jgi:prepilin-type N-terminal cleavage/methylation domain-containing protein
MKVKSKQSGFSLVELMMVIMISGMLSQMAVSEIRCFRAKARELALTNCANIIVKNLNSQIAINEPTMKHLSAGKKGADSRDYGVPDVLFKFNWSDAPCDFDALKAEHSKCVGDFNNDGKRDAADGTIMLGILGRESNASTVSPPKPEDLMKYLGNYDQWLDLNFSGNVSASDVMRTFTPTPIPPECGC